jgi:hypothetical protein
VRRHQLTTAVVCGLLAITMAGGCSRVPPPGGAMGSKPEKARKQAEELALNVVNGVAKTQAKSVPGLTKNSGNGRPGQTVTTTSSGSRFTVISPIGVTQERLEASAPPSSTSPNAPQPKSVSPPLQMTAVKDSTPPKSPPRPGSPAIIKEHVVSSIPYASEAEAEDDALTNARDVVERRLGELDPPVRYRPSLNEIKNEFARKDSRNIQRPAQAELDEYIKNGMKPELVAKLVSAEYDVEVTADQIRELRTKDRVTTTLRAFSGLIFIALAGFLFLRADDWTKGYLTRWLACTAVILVGGAAAALYFV